jgi:large subunit ribosomal protein L17
MRHRVDHRKLGRTAAHRKAMLCNMVTSLFAAERITTTDAKAKEARRLAEKLITRAKKGHAAHKDGMDAVALAHWRQAGRFIRKPAVLRKLFDEIAPQYLERPGGYTRIVRMQNRLGDNAQTVMLELVDTAKTSKPKIKSASEGSEGKGAEKEAKPKKSGEDKKAKSKTKSKSKSDSKAKSKSKGKAKTKTKRTARAAKKSAT